MQKESSLFFSFTLLRFANSDRWFRVLSKFGNACPNAYPVTFYKKFRWYVLNFVGFLINIVIFLLFLQKINEYEHRR